MTNIVPFRPDNNVVVGAIAEAARLLARTSEITVSMQADRANKLTAAALHEVFERLTWPELGRIIYGEDRPPNLQAIVMSAARTKWWSDKIVEEIVGHIMSNYIGERAA